MDDDRHNERVRRLEESLGFVQHDAETQTRDLRELSRQVYELSQRVERLEARLRDALDRLPPPPGDPADDSDEQ